MLFYKSLLQTYIYTSLEQISCGETDDDKASVYLTFQEITEQSSQMCRFSLVSSVPESQLLSLHSVQSLEMLTFLFYLSWLVRNDQLLQLQFALPWHLTLMNIFSLAYWRFCMSSFVYYLPKPFAHLFKFSVFSLLNYRSSLHFQEYKFTTRFMIINYFFQSVVHLFICKSDLRWPTVFIFYQAQFVD